MRICSIGAVAGAIGTLLPAASASAAVTGQTLSVTASSQKQPKTQFAPLNSLVTALDTAYTPPFTPNATQTVLNFSKDLSFNPGRLAQCDLNQISTVPASTSQSICRAAQVGQGAAIINGGSLTGEVIAYNGIPAGGSPTIGLHTDVFVGGTYSFSTTLKGVLNVKANTLSISIPPTGTSITHFDTTINRIRTGRKNGQPIYYVMARCRQKKWVSGETTTFDNGQQLTATSVQRCKPTAAKKQKQKKSKNKGKNGKRRKSPAEGPPRNGTYKGKTDQDAIGAPFRIVKFTLKKRKITLLVEPTVAREACVSLPVFTLEGNPRKKLSRNRAFTFTHTFLGAKIDRIHGRFVSSTKVEGYAVYNFPAQDLCSAGKMRVRFTAHHT
jgi:hypothetical protein